MKLNKTRQKLYLDGKVGLINDGTVEQLREVTNDRDYMGKFTYYHKNRIFPSDAPLDNIQYHPIAWFYENEIELPKVGEWWECVEDVKMNSDDRIEFIKQKINYKVNNDVIFSINKTTNANNKPVSAALQSLIVIFWCMQRCHTYSARTQTATQITVLMIAFTHLQIMLV